MKNTLIVRTGRSGWRAFLGTMSFAVMMSVAGAHAESRAELEKKFRETMDHSFMIGRWSMIREGELGREREEKYTINSVRKGEGDQWIVTARMQFGDVDVDVPVPVDVLWAGDTPVISLTKLPIPGVGTYTARVVIYENTYAGTWSGGDHGGLMNGIIVKQDKAVEAAEGAE